MAIRTDFTAGEVLAAADLNDTFAAKANLASPTFTGTPAAPTAAAGTNTTQVATTAFVQGAGGLVLVNATTFTAAGTLSMNNVFTSTYQNYRILFQIFGGTNASTLTFRLRVGGADASTSVYKYTYLGYNNVAGNEAAQSTATTSWPILTDQGNDQTLASYDILRPATTDTTAIAGTGTRLNGAGNLGFLTFGGFHALGTSYDGFSLIAATGTIQARVFVYGYRSA